MIRRPPISTRTDTPFPYATLFRSGLRTPTKLRADSGADVRPRPRLGLHLGKRDHPASIRARASAARRRGRRSEEHTSELQTLMRISYAVFCLKKKNEDNMTTSICNPKASTYNVPYHVTCINK